MVGNPCPRFHTSSPGSFSPPTGTMCQLWRRCITTRHTLVVRLALNTLLCVVVSLWGHGSQQAIPRVKVQREHGALASSPAISAHFSVWGAHRKKYHGEVARYASHAHCAPLWVDVSSKWRQCVMQACLSPTHSSRWSLAVDIGSLLSRLCQSRLMVF